MNGSLLTAIAKLLVAVVLASSVWTPATSAQEKSQSEFTFFESKIRPVLVEHCYKCHSQQFGKVKAGLQLDSQQGWQNGGESGPAIVASQPNESLLIEAIEYESFEMPPDRKLPATVIADFRKWIQMGAPDPRKGEHRGETKTMDFDAAAKFWSFQPLGDPPVPDVTDAAWPTSEIDRFILARLEGEGLQPAADATRSQLVRRLYVDLLGLPPSPQQQQSFVDSNDPHAYRKLVDQLLASPHFGERWGRHWLDLARYADSTGGGASRVMHDAWKYRDYVIRSFNDDKPFDRFVQEQVAGDLLPWTDVEEHADNLTATGLLVLGPRNYITDDATTFHMDGIDEQITTVGHIFLAMTVDCARCHDHKFDPIPQTDYYALAGIFDSTQTAVPVPGSKNFIWNTVADPHEDPDGSRLAEYEAKSEAVAMLASKSGKLQRELTEARKSGSLPEGVEAESHDAWITERAKEVAALKSELARLRQQIPPKPATLMGVCGIADPRDIQLRIRGNPHLAGEVVRRGFLQVVSHAMPGSLTDPEIPADQSGRFELANWLTSEQNPLTARVLVNRVWHHLFGRAIVATVDNFGTTGELPSDPNLLDWLARQFVEEGWSVKTLVRRIVMSRTYRLGTADNNDSGYEIDPNNRLFGRRTRRSLDAETIRDTILAVSGELDLDHGGKSFPDSLKQEFDHSLVGNRRSVYVPRFRNNQLEMFQVFDGANPALVVGQRDQTILPTQALLLIHDDFVIEQSTKSAQRLLATPGLTTDQRVELLYLRTLARKPAAEEAALAREFVEQPPVSDNMSTVELWSTLQQTLFECVDFRFVE